MSKKFSPICNYCIHQPNRNRKIPRRCKYRKNKILKTGDICKYFIPTIDFYCNLLDQRHKILHCIQRRFNPNGYDQWKKCKNKCRQFPLEISEILQHYIIGNTQINITKSITNSKRTIKRRTKKRTIKRRK